MRSTSRSAYSVETYRQLARRRLPRPVFDFVDGGAEDESTQADNVAGLRELRLLPKVLAGVGAHDLETEVCGITLSMPVICAPTGMSGVVHPDGELAAVRSAALLGTAAIVSSASTYSLEELGTGTERAPWFQIYPPADRALTLDLLQRALAIGVPVLTVTVDVPAMGKRERDLANRWTLQPRLTLATAMSFARHPAWCFRLAANPRIYAKNYADAQVGVRSRDVLRLLRRSTEAMRPTLSWDDLAWIRARWPEKLLVKGILRADDAERAVALGADGVIVSNHGGRQLDGAPATIHVLPSIVSAIAGRADVLVDGGIRRGSDVVRCLALGATACLIGRPWLYGLAADGTAGVSAVLEVLQDELRRTLVLLGCAAVRDADMSYICGRSAAG